jgi:CheY-like chemotaxis protein
LSSALKFARPGEVWLLAEPGHGSTEAVRLIVTDNGPVFASDVRDRLFASPANPSPANASPANASPASHAAAKADHPAPALAICRHIVTQMGGQIGCDIRRFDDGTEVNGFWITLPISALPKASDSATAGFVAQPETPPTHLPPPAPPRTRILLSGDMSASDARTATLLRRRGHHVDRVPDGLKTIEALRTNPYDLVLLDPVMLGPDEPGVMEAIRALPEPAGSIPVIALAANAATHHAPALSAPGFDGIMMKPVALTDLLATIRHHVWAKPVASPANGASATPDQDWPVTPSLLSSRRINELRATLPVARLINAVEECLVDMDRRLPALRRSLTARAPGAVSAHAQAMIGMAATYGMTALETRLRTITAAARDGELLSLGPSVVADLDRDFEQTARSLRDILRTEMV